MIRPIPRRKAADDDPRKRREGATKGWNESMQLSDARMDWEDGGGKRGDAYMGGVCLSMRDLLAVAV